MLPDELAAIEARAESHPGVSSDSPWSPVLSRIRAWLAEPDGPYPDMPFGFDILWLWYDDAAKDRQRLLDNINWDAREDIGIDE